MKNRSLDLLSLYPRKRTFNLLGVLKLIGEGLVFYLCLATVVLVVVFSQLMIG